MGISYRRAGVADLDSLVTLRCEFLEEANGRPCAAELAGAIRRMLERHLVEQTTVMWVAADGNEIVGTGAITFWERLPNMSAPDGRCAYIASMYTVPKYRGQGIASCIVRRLVEEARARGVCSVSLHALPPGVGVYKKAGFRVTEDEMVLGRE